MPILPVCVRTEVEGGLAGAPGAPGAMRVRVRARDWPWAPLAGLVLLVPGAALLAWSAAGRHLVEAGGAVVFVSLGLFAAYLALRHRRELVLSRTADGVRVSGAEGAGPWRRGTDILLRPDAAVEVVAFPLPSGAPDLPGRGGDLVLADAALVVRLARGAGPRGRARLEAAAATIRAGLRGSDPASS